ncbi:hypothetical protein KSB_43490 [Ktedonobacter robiniae]|uniref:DUF4258 domain-containing protein n=1 Tax=Ktedonobacter robiniae TaxID=2778365 RepID=A0ABQ3UST2_9CHLR|nr:hypothetical protein KSB_43490 [Ktedonobacter robiniae]
MEIDRVLVIRRGSAQKNLPHPHFGAQLDCNQGRHGASIACLHEGKIIFLRVYAMTALRYEWEG